MPPIIRTLTIGPAHMSEAILEARELHAYYGASHILHGVDFHVDRSETVGLMGRNGMGKSTLIRSMLGIVKPRGGEVFVCGSPMTGAEPHVVARKGIAYVPEGRGIFPNLTVRENLSWPRGRAPTAAATGRTSACSRRSRASPSASAMAAGNSPAASSRC